MLGVLFYKESTYRDIRHILRLQIFMRADAHKHSPTTDLVRSVLFSSPLRPTCRLPLGFLTLLCLQWEAIVTNPMTPQQSVQMTAQMWSYMGLCFLNVKQALAGHCSIKTQSM